MTTRTSQRDEPGAPPAAPAAGGAPRWVWPAVAGLGLLALALRCAVGLNGGVWPDEAQFLFVVAEPSWGAMVDFLREHESHPPLFYVLMRAWLSLTGDGDAAAVALPIALGVVLVPALHAVGSRLFTWRVGLLAATAAALSPVLTANGAMARPYSLLPLLVLGTTYALVRALDAGGLARWSAYAGLTLALVYTHNWGWLVLAGQWAATAVCLARGVGRPRRAVLRGWAGAHAAVAAGFAPWLPALLQQRARAGYPPVPFYDDAHTLLDWVGVGAGILLLLVHTILVPPIGGKLAAAAMTWALAVGVVALVAGRRARPGEQTRAGTTSTALTVVAVSPVAAVAAAIALSQRSNLLVAHCLAVLAPLALLVLAAGIERWRLLGQARLAAALAVVALAASAVALPPLWQHTRSNAREVAAAVTSRTAPSDLVVVAPWWLASLFNRYYGLPNRQIDFPASERVGAIPYDDQFRRLADPDALARARQDLAAQRAQGGRAWLVVDEGNLACDGPCVAQLQGTDDFMEMGALRATQLRDELTRLYGPPVVCLRDGQAESRLQDTVACLFAPR